MKKALAMVGLLCFSVSAGANDSAVRGVGGTVAPMAEHPTVRMVSEKVHARIGWESACVRCEFVFKNEGPAAKVKMGFPEEAGGDVGPILKSDLKNFKSWVDGRRIRTRFITVDRYYNDWYVYKAWHVKDVYFGKGQTRRVVDEYTSPLGDVSIGDNFFKYILRSGKSWKGKIGKAEITIDASEVSSYWKVMPLEEPKGYVKRGGKISWILRNFEPNDDIFINLEPEWKIFVGNAPYGGRVSIEDPETFARHRIVMASVHALPKVVTIWDAKEHACTVRYLGRSLKMRPGSRTAVLDGTQSVTLSRAPYIKWETLHAPIISVAKALGMQVSYDPQKKHIVILE